VWWNNLYYNPACQVASDSTAGVATLAEQSSLFY
jgi:hypothetical protein